MRAIRAAVAIGLLAGLSLPASSQVDFRWSVAPAMGGTLVAFVRNASGSYFRLSCSAGMVSPAADLSFDPARYRTQKSEPLQIVVDGAAFPFTAGQNFNARGERVLLERLAKALTGSSSRTFDVELPRLRRKETFSLLDVGKALRDGVTKTILDPCL